MLLTNKTKIISRPAYRLHRIIYPPEKLICVLVWGGIKLNFFTVVIMGLCFGFVMKTVLITQRCFLLLSSVSMDSRSFLLLTPPQQRGDWGCTRSWEETEPWQLTPTAHRDIPDRMESCLATKAGGRRKNGETVGVMASLHMMEPPACSWKVVKQFLGFLSLHV